MSIAQARGPMAAGFLIPFLILTSASGRAQTPTGIVKAKKIAMTFYDSKTSAPALTVRAERVYTEQERRGFFRIGLLPVAVFDGVSLEVHQPTALTNDLTTLIPRNISRKGRLELRQMRLSLPGDSIGRLECGRARILSDGKWELSGGVSLKGPCGTDSALTGTLEISGQAAGRLALKKNPPVTLNIFEASSINPEN